MLYLLMFITALALVNVFKMGLIAGALTSVLAWTVIGVILSVVTGGKKTDKGVEEGQPKPDQE